MSSVCINCCLLYISDPIIYCSCRKQCSTYTPSCWMRGIRKHMERLHISLLIYTDGFPLISELRLSQRSSLTYSLCCGKCFCKRSQILLVCTFTLDTVQMQKRAKLWTYAHAHANQWTKGTQYKACKQIDPSCYRVTHFCFNLLTFLCDMPVPFSASFFALLPLISHLLPHLCSINVESIQVSVCRRRSIIR